MRARLAVRRGCGSHAGHRQSRRALINFVDHEFQRAADDASMPKEIRDALDRSRWRVWVFEGDQWQATPPVMPEGAALSYAARRRYAGAVVLELAAEYPPCDGPST